MSRVLVVDDEPAVRDALKRALQMENHVVDLAADGIEALERLFEPSSPRPDAMILDILMPNLDGLETVRRLRASGDRIPILMLTARDAVADRVEGLEAGADDYLIKPFHLDELCARIRSLSRRAQGLAVNRIEVGALALDLGTSQVTCRGEAVELTRREFALLQILLERAGKLVRRESLLNSLYGLDTVVGDNALEVLVHALRKKLGYDTVRTVRGFGYMIPREPE